MQPEGSRIVRLDRPSHALNGPEDGIWLLSDDGDVLEGIKPSPWLREQMQGDSGYFYAKPREGGWGWCIFGPAPEPH